MAVDDVYRARAERVKGPVPIDHDRRVLVNAYSEHGWVLGDGGEQSSDPSAFGEVLVNDHVLRQPESRRHLYVAELADSLDRTADQHHLAERRRVRRGSGDDSALPVNLLDAFGERRASQAGRDPELIAAGEENRGRIGKNLQSRVF